MALPSCREEDNQSHLDSQGGEVWMTRSERSRDMTSRQNETASAHHRLLSVLFTIRRVGLVVLILTALTLAFLWADAPNETEIVMAQEFLMTDSTGATRARLGMDGESAGLTIYDQRGVARLVVKVGEDGSPEIAFMDGQKMTRARLALADGKNPELVFLHPGKPSDRVRLGVTGDGEGYLQLFDPRTGAFWAAPRGSDSKLTQTP